MAIRRTNKRAKKGVQENGEKEKEVRKGCNGLKKIK